MDDKLGATSFHEDPEDRIDGTIRFPSIRPQDRHLFLILTGMDLS